MFYILFMTIVVLFCLWVEANNKCEILRSELDFAKFEKAQLEKKLQGVPEESEIPQ